MKKVYPPLVLTCAVTMLIYVILPDKFTIKEIDQLVLSKDLWYLHHLDNAEFSTLALHVFGWKNWYVFCIMIFYTLFYLSQSITCKKPVYQTCALWLMLVIYYVIAILHFGTPEAHWYRYCWVFFLGHVHGKMVLVDKRNKWDIVMLFLLMMTVLVESLPIVIGYVMAICIIVTITHLNKRYTMDSKILAFVGGISYFFYLSHEKIGYPIIAYMGTYSVILWIGITIIISVALKTIYEKTILKI